MANVLRSLSVPDILVFGLAFLACSRFTYPLLEPEEARYAELGRQTGETGSWVVPTLDGEAYLDKPPLLYWFEATSFAAFGASVATARLVPILIAAGIVWVVYRAGRSAGGPGAGLVSSAILVSMPDFLYRAPMVTPNGLLALFTTAGLVAGARALRGPGVARGWWVVSAVCCGAGVMTKGPVAAVLIVVPLFAVSVRNQRLARPGLGAWVAYAAMALLVAGPWFVAVSLRRPEFLEYFLWKHHVERALRPFDHAKPWWYYLPQILLGTLPWTPLVFVAARHVRTAPPAVAFGLAGAGVGLLLFSLSGSKRPVYLIPVYPPLAWATGVWLSDHLRGGAGRVLGLNRGRWLAALVAVPTVVVTGMWLVLPSYHRQFSAEPLWNEVRDADRVYAVPYGSPAAEFARGHTVPVVTWDGVDTLPPPGPGEPVAFVIPKRDAGLIAAHFAGPHWATHAHADVVVVTGTGGP